MWNRKFLWNFSTFIPSTTGTKPSSQLPSRGSIKSDAKKDALGSEDRDISDTPRTWTTVEKSSSTMVETKATPPSNSKEAVTKESSQLPYCSRRSVQMQNLPLNSTWISLKGERDRQYCDNIKNVKSYPKIQHDSAWRRKRGKTSLYPDILILCIYITDPTLLMSTPVSRNTVLVAKMRAEWSQALLCLLTG